MDNGLPAIYLARHGETAWSITGQHTGRTDLALTERGERNARRLGERLAGLMFAKVLTSPSQRAVRTCELAGFRTAAEVDANLVEWNYGDYEGLRTVQIHSKRPDWQLFRDGPNPHVGTRQATLPSFPGHRIGSRESLAAVIGQAGGFWVAAVGMLESRSLIDASLGDDQTKAENRP